MRDSCVGHVCRRDRYRYQATRHGNVMFIPRTKVQAAAFAVTMAALGAFVMVLAQAYHIALCPVTP